MNELFDHSFILKLLDWPFMSCIVIIAVGLFFRTEIRTLIRRGGISLKWGGSTIDIKEIPDKVDQDFSQLHEEIEILKQRIDSLQEAGNISITKIEIPKLPPEAARQRIFKSLNSGEYKWRSIERLSSISGMSEDETLKSLQTEPTVVLSRGKSGRRIARIK